MVIAWSTGVLVVIAAGLAFRRRRRVHIPIMLTAFALDLASVVWLTVKRNAVGKAASHLTPILGVHIGFALATILLYVAMIVIGGRLAATGRGRRAHRAGAAAFLAVRLGTYVTSYFVA